MENVCTLLSRSFLTFGKTVFFLSLFTICSAFTKVNSQGTVATDSFTISAMADAFVRNGSFANTNYGFDTALYIKGATTAGETRHVYLKFPLTKISDVVSAKLRLYVRNSEGSEAVTVSVFGVDNDNWTETGITWNNAPAAIPAAIGHFSANNGGRYYEVDVTSFVQAQFANDKMASLVVKDTSSKNSLFSFNCRENLFFVPELVIATSALLPAGNAQLFVENLSRFPSNNDFVASRIQVPWSRDRVVYNTNHDTVRVRLHNKGLDSLVVSNILLSNKKNWKILSLNGTAYDSATSLPLRISADAFADLQLHFIAIDSSPTRVKIILDELTLVSNDDRTPFKTLYLRGLWQREGEGSKEPTAQEMINAFGFRTRTGFGSTDPDRGAGSKPKGDEIVTSYFVRVDTLHPVKVWQMGSYHGCCTVQPDTISWYQKGAATTLFPVTPHLPEDAQRLLPRSSRSTTFLPAEGAFSPAGPFGLKVGARDWSDTLLTPDRKIGLRVWKVLDARGLVIPDAYLIANDYLGTSSTNFDYNDNMYFVTNIRPELGPASASVLATSPAAVDFDERTLQRDSSFLLSLKNTGQAYPSGVKDPTLTIASVVVVGPNSQEFSATMPLKASLDAQDATTLTITFRPLSEGLKIADLLIYYNNAGSPVRVPLYGIGKEERTTVTVPYRIKSGSATDMVVNGNTWISDASYAFDNVAPFSNTQLTQIKATNESRLYLSQQSSSGDKKPFRYELSLQNGKYWVRLHFAEIYWGLPGGNPSGGTGSRVMSVQVENELKLINLDVNQEVGAAAAVIKNIPVTVSDGKLDIHFLASANRPMLCAVEVYQFKTAIVTSTGNVPPISNLAKPYVFPNPLHRTFTVRFPSSYIGPVNLQLVDMAGRVYQLGKSQLQNGVGILEMNIAKFNLSAGIYVLRIFSGNNQTDSVKLLVQ